MSIQQVSRGLMAELFARFQKDFLQKTSDFEQFYHKQLLNSQLQMTSKAIHNPIWQPSHLTFYMVMQINQNNLH